MHAFLYSYPAGTWKDLGNLPGTGAGVDSFAYGINDKGQIVGKGYTPTRANSCLFILREHDDEPGHPAGGDIQLRHWYQ